MRNYKLHLIRHGITQGNLEGRYIGRTDLDLTPEAAQQLIEYREEGYYPPVELVYSSPLKRCLETARCIYPDQKPVVVEEMRDGEAIGFPDVIDRYRTAGEKIGVYPIGENSWMDMGQLEELEKMRRKLENQS